MEPKSILKGSKIYLTDSKQLPSSLLPKKSVLVAKKNGTAASANMYKRDGSGSTESDESGSLSDDSIGGEDSDGSDRDYDEEEEDDDEDAIRAYADGKLQNRPIKKVKHTTLRPTPAPAFSQALSHLLSLPPTTSSLAPKHAAPSAQAQRLERRARSLIRETKAQHFSRGHIRDVIGGWGSRPQLPFSLWESKQAREFERAQRGDAQSSEITETGAEREKRLRKLAQRGVVRLFNAIGAAQGAPERSERNDSKRRRKNDGTSVSGSQATTSTAQLSLTGGKVTRQPNVLGGRGKGEALSNLSKQSFLDLIRAGTSTSTSLPMSA